MAHAFHTPRILLVGLIVAALASHCNRQAEPRAAAGRPHVPCSDTVSVLWYNVENLFDLTNDGSEYPEYKPNQCGWNEFTFHVKLSNIASVIRSANADVVALGEVENERVARLLAKELKNRGLTYEYLAAGDRPNRTNTMPVILSRLPIPTHRGFATVKTGNYWSRNLLEADISLGDRDLKLFVNHWPSKSNPESFRLETARILQARLRELSAGADYLVLGDLNANYNECETFATEGMDNTGGQTGINHVLRTVTSKPGDFISLVTEQTLTASPEPSLYNLWMELPENRRGSASYNGQWVTPDNLLVPASLYDSSGVSYLDNSFSVYTMDGKLLRNGSPFSWQVSYRGKQKYHKGEGYSDHLPLLVKLYCGPFRPRGTLSAGPEGTWKNKEISFETGREGWIGACRGVAVDRDTVRSSSGRFCLWVRGTVGRENETVAMARIPWRLVRGPSADKLSLRLLGQGAVCIRVRQSDTRNWVYFVGQNLLPRGQAKYEPCSWDEWTAFELGLGGTIGRGRDMEVEMRAKKMEPVDMRIDDVWVGS